MNLVKLEVSKIKRLMRPFTLDVEAPADVYTRYRRRYIKRAKGSDVRVKDPDPHWPSPQCG